VGETNLSTANDAPGEGLRDCLVATNTESAAPSREDGIGVCDDLEAGWISQRSWSSHSVAAGYHAGSGNSSSGNSAPFQGSSRGSDPRSRGCREKGRPRSVASHRIGPPFIRPIVTRWPAPTRQGESCRRWRNIAFQTRLSRGRLDFAFLPRQGHRRVQVPARLPDPIAPAPFKNSKAMGFLNGSVTVTRRAWAACQDSQRSGYRARLCQADQ